MVGAEVIREAIKDIAISSITAIVRKPLEIEHPKLKTVLHHDFMNYAALDEVFKSSDACIWCLGISQSQVSKEKYEQITYDYVVAAAEAMLKANPSIIFMFVSGGGADSTEKSRTLFARVKGKAENALLKMPFKKLYIARPAAIMPIHKNKNAAFAYKLMIPLFPILRILTPSYVITSVELAKAMLDIVKNGSNTNIFENKTLQEIYKKTN